MLRGLVRSGALKAAYSGNKALLYYPNVIKVLQEGTEPPEAVKRQILRLMQQSESNGGAYPGCVRSLAMTTDQYGNY